MIPATLLRRLHRAWPVLAACFAAGTLIAACIGNPVRPAPTRPAATSTPGLALAEPDRERGAQLWVEKQCAACHGPQALGGVGQPLAQTRLSFAAFLDKVRNAIPPKPAFAADVLSDQEVYDIYGWVQGLSPQGEATPLTAAAVVVLQPGQEELPEGPILGMSVWTSFGCDRCHGPFAQGSGEAPALAGLTFPYEMERAKMRQTADRIPEHAPDHMRDAVLQRLYNWLQAGADPKGGC